MGVGLSCSTTTKLSQRRSSSSFSSKTTRRCCVKMAVSLDEKKKKNFSLRKSEEAFAAAKVSCSASGIEVLNATLKLCCFMNKHLIVYNT